MKILIWIARIVVGVLFTLSGLIKANDPIGFSYKLEEYFEVFANKAQFYLDTHGSWFPDWLLELAVWKFHLLHDIALPFATILVVLEIVLGICILTGTKMKWVSSIALVLILFFTFLTFISWNYNLVRSCGCFGDAIKITPDQSFYKDLILLFFILLLFIYRRSINSLFEQTGDRVVLGVSILCSLLLVVYTYRHLPIIDFRPYAVGENIKENMIRVEGKKKFYYTLKNLKTGEEQEFSEYPKDVKNWKYISIRIEKITPGIDPKIEAFTIFDDDGNDLLPQILEDSAYTFMLISYDLEQLGEFEKEGKVAVGFKPTEKTKSQFEVLNAFAKEADKEGMKFMVLTASGIDYIGSFRHQMQTEYPFYGCDGTVLKTIIRANPGLVLMKNGEVLGQWHINDFPDFEDLMEDLNINYSKDL